MVYKSLWKRSNSEGTGILINMYMFYGTPIDV
jgi:hypothetical protein